MSFHRLALRAGSAALLLTAAACAASSPEPPRHDPYFPAALALAPDDGHLFIVNANSDLKYGAGSVQAYDLDAVAAMVAGWAGGTGPTPEGCVTDAERPLLAICPSSAGGAHAGYVVDSSVQIGNFAAAGRVQERDGGALRLFSAVRGDPSITWVDFDQAAGAFACGGSGSFPRCDERHRLNVFRNDSTLGELSSEPFGIAVDSARENVVVTHLTTGRVSLVRAPRAAEALPTLEDSLTGIWAPDSNFGLISAVGVATRLPGDSRDLFYVTSRSEARINMVRAVDYTLGDGSPGKRLVRAGSFFAAPGPFSNGLPGDTRGITFNADGTRAFIITRSEATETLPANAGGRLVSIDTSIDATGVPVNRLVGELEVCPQVSDLALFDGGEGLRVYVTCFDSGEVWIIDPEASRLAGVIRVGRGPAAIAVAGSRQLAFAANYGEDTITVIDLDVQSPTYHRAVLELGQKRTP